jgi:hypothetical protein
VRDPAGRAFYIIGNVLRQSALPEGERVQTSLHSG